LNDGTKVLVQILNASVFGELNSQRGFRGFFDKSR
jgi:hypothetical protein